MTYIMRDTGVPSAGVSAQDVLKVLPEVVGSVFEDNDEYADAPVKDKDGKPVLDDAGNVVTATQLIRRRDESKRSYTVEYSGVIALCVAALKELDQAVIALEKNSLIWKRFCKHRDITLTPIIQSLVLTPKINGRHRIAIYLPGAGEHLSWHKIQ